MNLRTLTLALTVFSAWTAFAQDASAPPAAGAPASGDGNDLAKQLTNPIASLASLPLQSNFDFHLGPNRDGFRYTLNIQPVLPFKLSSQVNLISRTILPVIHQNSVQVAGDSATGLADTVQSLFISPNKIKPFIYGIGPVFQIPTATNGAFASRKLSIGPTVVVLKPIGGFTIGILAFQVWSVAGSANHKKVSGAFFEPFMSYTTKESWTFSFDSETSYDSVSSGGSIPLIAGVSKLTKLGGRPVSVQATERCWVDSPTYGPTGCGARFGLTFLFPKTKEPAKPVPPLP